MPALKVSTDGVDHALRRGLAEYIGCSVGIHKDIHERLKCLDLTARLGNAQVDDIALNVTGAAGFTTAI